ncbi:hypothetical protein DPEC_G00168000 [Dallia pectoralis]|uniref:Uncharacterized protein n=1 Tax=Dallia pectoralis TaxID=75939 RepID=A0ACC2GHZ7_DALPE|nr:hypothetical protein DPEC_G00168000 [Dallia pectoralis]
MVRLYKPSKAEIAYITRAKMRLRWADVREGLNVSIPTDCNGPLQARGKAAAEGQGGEAEELEWMGLGEETNFETEDPAEGEADGSVAGTNRPVML